MNSDADQKLRATVPQSPPGLEPGPRVGPSTRAHASLLVFFAGGVRAISLEEGRRVVVGRDPEVTMCVADDSLSRRHAAFELISGQVWVQDLGSTNGTVLGSKRIDRARLEPGIEVLLGSITVSLHLREPCAGKEMESHERFRWLLEQEVLRARTFGRGATLLMLAAEGSGASTLAELHAPTVLDHLRPVDHMARYGPAILEVLLAESSAERGLELAKALRTGGQPGTSLRCSIASFPQAGTSAEELLSTCLDGLRRTSPSESVQIAQAGDNAGEKLESDGPVAKSPAMRRVFETVDRVAGSTLPVLLVGDTGSGKEVVARALHERSSRAAGPMACVNCGAIPQSLVESVLFGHEKGAFTGASQRSQGLFEEADGGTLLLDEIGELSLAAQAALLRALETQTIRRVGSGREIAVDVRILAATHRDLEQMCRESTFRWDLFYRLNVLLLPIPSLAERPEDIAPLAERFLRQARAAACSPVVGIRPEAMAMLHRYAWPGNVRELRNAIHRAVVIARDELIGVDDLPERVREGADPVSANGALPPDAPHKTPRTDPASRQTPTAGSAARRPPLDYKSRLSRFEREMIVAALDDVGWSRAEAARRLGMPVRTLSHRMKKLEIVRR